jgi:hypothetical protein
LVEVKPTPTSLGDVQTISALELVDVGVLVVTLRLLENRRPLAFRELGQGGKWPQRTPPIAPMRGMGESLAQLRHSGFLTVTQRSVDYGPRTIEIAREWGIELTETKEMATA